MHTARPPLPLGVPGSISVSESKPGIWVARCNFRDQDGVTRPVLKHRPSKTAARNALNEAISARQRAGRQRAGELTPGSTFDDAAVLFLARVANRRADSTHATPSTAAGHAVMSGARNGGVRSGWRSVRAMPDNESRFPATSTEVRRQTEVVTRSPCSRASAV